MSKQTAEKSQRSLTGNTVSGLISRFSAGADKVPSPPTNPNVGKPSPKTLAQKAASPSSNASTSTTASPKPVATAPVASPLPTVVANPSVLVKPSSTPAVVEPIKQSSFKAPPVSSITTKPKDGKLAPGECPIPGSGEEMFSLYVFKGVLGTGNYSVVKKAVNIETEEEVAIKVVDKEKLTPEDTAALSIEVGILHEIDHPNVLKMFRWYEEPTAYYIVTELMPGGELFERIVQKEYYSEEDARQVVYTLASTLKYLHDHQIAHRDLKPENILLKSKTDDSSLKLADFGFAVHVKPKGQLTSCGTPAYVAPEIIMGFPYGTAVDVWSLGVIVYILLCGFPPFYHQNQNQLFRIIRAAKYEFTKPYWDPVSDSAKDFISKMLVRDTTVRLTMNGVLDHPWLRAATHTVDLTVTLHEMRLFNAKRKLRAGLKAIIAGERMMDMYDLSKS